MGIDLAALLHGVGPPVFHGLVGSPVQVLVLGVQVFLAAAAPEPVGDQMAAVVVGPPVCPAHRALGIGVALTGLIREHPVGGFPLARILIGDVPRLTLEQVGVVQIPLQTAHPGDAAHLRVGLGVGKGVGHPLIQAAGGLPGAGELVVGPGQGGVRGAEIVLGGIIDVHPIGMLAQAAALKPQLLFPGPDIVGVTGHQVVHLLLGHHELAVRAANGVPAGNIAVKVLLGDQIRASVPEAVGNAHTLIPLTTPARRPLPGCGR